MLTRLRSTLAPIVSTVLTLGFAALPVSPASSTDWTVDLAQGRQIDVAYTDGALRLTGTTGLLTLPVHHLAGPVARISPALDAVTPPGTSATVDVRGLLAGGRWSEWVPGESSDTITLPAPSTDVQLRVVLTGGPFAPASSGPQVRGLHVHAEDTPSMRVSSPPNRPDSFQVIATREGLVRGRTANGHRIRSDDLFVALPSRRALADTNGSEYSVKVCARSGYCAWAPVWDVGPWNVDDDYWSSERQNFDDLPQGVPQAQSAFRDGYNGGKDGSGRKVGNAAGIDLSDGIYRSALGLSGNALVTVSYLWTGALPLSAVDATGHGGVHRDHRSDTAYKAGFDIGIGIDIGGNSGDDNGGGNGKGGNGKGGNGQRGTPPANGARVVTVRTAPDDSAPAAGVASDKAGVPVQCVTHNGWVRIDPDAYLPAKNVIVSNRIDHC